MKFTVISSFDELEQVETEWAVITTKHLLDIDNFFVNHINSISNYEKKYRHWFKCREREDTDSWDQICVIHTKTLVEGDKYIDVIAGTSEQINISYYDEFNVNELIARSKLFKGWTWVIPKNHRIEKDLLWFPPEWEQSYCRIYKSVFGNEERDGALLVHHNNQGIHKYVDEIVSKEKPPAVSLEMDFSKSDWCYVVPNTDILIDTSFIPDTKKTHIWQTQLPNGDIDEFGDVRLYHSSSYNKENKIFVSVIGNIKPKQDVVFISYYEPNAEENFQRLLEFAPHAKHVKNITGIGNAHRRAAEIATTDYVYVVDGDAWIVDGFDFNFVPTNWEKNNVWVWRSRNPINNLLYGNGGVKLFPRKALLNVDNWEVDFSLSFGNKYGFKIQRRISNITKIDSSPFQVWKSAVRECAKLSLKTDATSQNRIHKWLNNSQGPYSEYAVKGGLFGIQLVQDGKIELINDFEYLENTFKSS